MSGLLRSVGVIVAAIFLSFASAGPTWAQAVRTWVSGVGDDANPCSRTSPCKTFAGAVSKTAAGGEISVLDAGGFGSLTITGALSIVADGPEAGVLVTGTNGITINAGATDNVSLRGLTIEGAGQGLSGIQVLRAGNVYVTQTVIRGFNYGVDVEPTSSAPRVYLKDLQINNNVTGVYIHAGSMTTGVVLDRCTISGNSTSAMLLDTSTSVARALFTSFANTGVTVSNGAQLISNGNNFFAGGIPPGTTVNALQ